MVGSRRLNRWVSVLFMATVLLNFASFALAAPPEWVWYLPLPPLFVLMITGTVLYVRPWFAKAWAGSSRPV